MKVEGLRDIKVVKPELRTPEIGNKGLKDGALGFVSNVVIGVASTAPAYSLAATLGFIAVAVGFQSPAILWLAFVPMLFIAAAFHYMNKADPDCGASFTWVTRAMGPHAGWMAGWAVVVADIIVMANLAQIAGTYTFTLFGAQGLANSTFAVTTAGIVWIVILTAICVIGIELSARTQFLLLGVEIVILAIFAVVALVKIYAGLAGVNAVVPQLSWFNPFAVPSLSALSAGVLLAIFIYWGWDRTLNVNEESKDSGRAPGIAAIVSTVVLLAIYVIVGVAAQGYGGVQHLVQNQNDVISTLGSEGFGPTLDKLLILAVLTSAAASTQTTILPTARTSLSMARYRALPEALGRVNPRYLTPHISTIWMGALSIVWYVGLTLISQNILYDSISALGLMIAFYYALTGFACAIYYRRRLLESVRNFLFMGVAPVLGGLILVWAFVQSCITLANPSDAYSGALFGVGVPLVIGVGSLLVGLLLMLREWYARPEFFRRRPQVAEPAEMSHTKDTGRLEKRR